MSSVRSYGDRAQVQLGFASQLAATLGNSTPARSAAVTDTRLGQRHANSTHARVPLCYHSFRSASLNAMVRSARSANEKMGPGGVWACVGARAHRPSTSLLKPLFLGGSEVLSETSDTKFQSVSSMLRNPRTDTRAAVMLQADFIEKKLPLSCCCLPPFLNQFSGFLYDEPRSFP